MRPAASADQANALTVAVNRVPDAMMRKKKKDLSMFYEGMDPEIREALLQIQEDRKSGKLKTPPGKAADCRSLEDLCLYIFKLAHLDGSYQILKTDARVQRWVWFGHEFSVRLVAVVVQVLPQIADRNNA